MTTHRLLASSLLGITLLALAGCMTQPARPLNADGTYCFKIGKSYRPTVTCTTEAAPPAAVEAEAKRFEPLADALTIYIVRKRWGDTGNQVVVNADGRARVTTIPESLTRLRVPAGPHRLVLEWEGKAVEFDVQGAVGEVRYVELVGSVWSWGSRYQWEAGSAAQSPSRAMVCKLIADVDLRR
jgi:hypothetical protein